MKAALRQPASFTLVEILAATAILSILFAIMFGILQQTSVGWQAANRKVEASQAARLALEQISRDLGNCLVVIRTNVAVPGTNRLLNYTFGFAHLDSSRGNGSLWYPTEALPSEPNDSIFVVTQMPASTSGGGADLCEVGYVPLFVSRAQGYGNTPEGRYVLCRSLPLTNGTPLNDFTQNFFWEETPGVKEGGTNVANFFPIVDHCLRFEVRFVYLNASGTVVTNASTWGRPTNSATGWTTTGLPPGAAPGLPLAADITLSVLDERSAERLYRIQGRTVLPAGTLQMIPTNLAAVTPVAVRRTLEEGLTTFSRRVYFKNR